jgi:hypothetical protein
VIAGAAGGLLGTLILPWYSYPLIVGSLDVSAWHSSSFGQIALIGALALAAGAVAVVLGHELPATVLVGLLCVGLVVAAVTVARLSDVRVGVTFGPYVTIVSGVVAALGAYGMGAQVGIWRTLADLEEAEDPEPETGPDADG